MRKLLAASLSLVALSATALVASTATGAADELVKPTFTKDVLPILQQRCQDCHRVGGDGIAGVFAPMPLTSYDEVRPWAKAVGRVVASKEMPPWDATDHTLGQFSNERVMTDVEREVIQRWVQTGAAAGDLADAPPPRVFDDKQGWLLGPPDFIVTMPEPYWVSDDVTDDQPRISFKITEEMLPEPRWVRGIEIKPGPINVHHAVGRAMAPAWGDHPEESFSAGSIAAGEDPILYPPGFGNLLRAGTEISLSMHYFKEPGPGTGFFDQSSIGFYFHPEDAEIKYKVSRGGIGTRNWEVPPGHPNWRIGSSQVYDQDVVFISLHPHMHFRGESMKYTAYYPDGSTEVLLDVPDYDYGWQTQYTYKAPKFIPKGTRVEVIAIYDNSESKKAEFPILDITQAVPNGARSVDEMYIPYVEVSVIDESDAERFKATSPRPIGGGGSE